MVVEGVSNDTKGTKKNLVFNTCGAVCCRKMVVEGVSNDTKDTKKYLVFNTCGAVCCRRMVVGGVSNDTKDRNISEKRKLKIANSYPSD